MADYPATLSRPARPAPTFSLELASAAKDYRWLLDKDYPLRASLKLVGDRYRLDRAERIILFRGVLDAAASADIAARIRTGFTPRASLCVDGYNVLFTIVNYRRGHPLFIGSDGLLRDAGGAHGRIGKAEDFEEALGLLVDGICACAPGSVRVYLDAPLSGSGRHADALRQALAARGVDAAVELAPSADPPVRDFEGGFIASADSAIALSARSPLFDLARRILEDRFKAAFPDLGAALAGGAKP